MSTGVTPEQIDAYFCADAAFREQNPDVPSSTSLLQYGEMVLDFHDKTRRLSECQRTSETYVTIRDSIDALNKKLQKFEKKPPAELLPFLSNGRYCFHNVDLPKTVCCTTGPLQRFQMSGMNLWWRGGTTS